MFFIDMMGMGLLANVINKWRSHLMYLQIILLHLSFIGENENYFNYFKTLHFYAVSKIKNPPIKY